MSPDDQNFTEDDLELEDSELEGDEPLDDSEDDSLLTEDEVTDDQSDGPDKTKAKVAKLKAEIKDLNSRIGKLAQANDERLKAAEVEWRTWGENYRNWATEQIDASYTKGKEDAEEKFLPNLSPEEKANYYENSREQTKRQKEEARQRQAAAASQQAQATAAVRTAVAEAIANGVPINVLDMSSPEAVMRSALAYSASNGRNEAGNGPAEDLEKTVKDLQEEVTRLKRDNSGESRTGMGVGGGSGNMVKQRKIKELDDAIAKAKRQHKISEVMQLTRQKNALLTRG